MRWFATVVLIPFVLVGLLGISLAEEVKTAESKIIMIDANEKYIGLKLDGRRINIHTDEKTRIIEGGKDIPFSDLEIGDKVGITYEKEEGFLGLEEDLLAKEIRVVKVKTKGTGKVLFVEPETKSISIKLGNMPLIFGINKDTTFKGVDGLKDVKSGDKVFIDYKIAEDGKKILILLEKAA